jgi:hypothetical protein
MTSAMQLPDQSSSTTRFEAARDVLRASQARAQDLQATPLTKEHKHSFPIPDDADSVIGHATHAASPTGIDVLAPNDPFMPEIEAAHEKAFLNGGEARISGRLVSDALWVNGELLKDPNRRFALIDYDTRLAKLPKKATPGRHQAETKAAAPKTPTTPVNERTDLTKSL